MSPNSKDEYPEEWFIPVNSWSEVMARLNVSNHSYHSYTEFSGDDESPWAEWLADMDFRAEQSQLEVPAMPLLTNKKAEPITHRSKTKASWSPFPVAVTKMISKKEMREIPEALEAMRKEFARLSGKCWIEKDRRSKKEVIAEAQKNGEEVHFSMVHGIIGEKGYELPKGDPRGSTRAERWC